MGDLQERIKSAKNHLQNLKAEIEKIKAAKVDSSISKSANSQRNALAAVRPLKCIRTFKGHTGEITSMNWSNDDQKFVSTGKDGLVIIWNALQKKRLQTISHKTQWLMTCAYEREKNVLVGTGGADRMCSIFVTEQPGVTRPAAELVGHDGYLSCCRFIDETNIITTSGDSTIRLWDIPTVQTITTFSEHAADCMSASIHHDKKIFATGSADCTVKIWDMRSGKSTHSFSGHESDINCVEFFPDGYCVGTASTDSTCRIFDIRSYGQVACFESNDSQIPASSVTFSKSGRILFAGYDNHICKGWDVTSAAKTPAITLSEHSAKVTVVGINSTGRALCTGSVDMSLKIWS